VRGISLIIFAGIAAGLPRAVAGTLELVRTGAFSIPVALFIFALVLAVTGFVWFVECGQRRIPVNYAKRQVGRKIYGGQSSHLPLKLNMSGVIPPIFASSIILFPATLVGWSGSGEGWIWLRDIAATMQEFRQQRHSCQVERGTCRSISAAPRSSSSWW
jgi:preprotein translocase subunit SecY